MSHFDSIRPGGVMPPGMVMGASDYIRWDITQSKAINGDIGTTPTNTAGIGWSGTPALTVQSIVVIVSTGGMNGGGAKFDWSLNGVVQATGVIMVGSVALGTTGITVLFTNGAYTAGATSTYAPWNPTSPIVIGGAGLSMPQNSSLVGGLRTSNAGRLVMGSATNKVPTLSPNRTRSIFMATPQLESGGNGGAVGTLLTTAGVSIAIPSRYLHHDGGSRLSSVILSYFCNATLIGSIATGFVFAGFDNAGTSVGPTYEVGGATIGWSSTTWTIGQYVRPFGATWGLNPYLGYYFRCTVGGTSGGSEPTWNLTPGSTTTDGTVTWLCIGGAGVTGGYAGSVGQARYDFDPIQSATLNLGTTRYSIQVGANAGLAGVPSGAITLFGVTFNFDTITDMTPY